MPVMPAKAGRPAARRWFGSRRALALAAALVVVAPGARPQTPELDSVRIDPTRVDSTGSAIRSPVITNTPLGRQALPAPPTTDVPGGAPARLAPVPPALPQARPEFQEFVNLGLGRELPLFGYDLFKDPLSTFAPVEAVPPTADYVIGPGDEVHIRAWGQVDIDYRAIVDRDGRIFVPKIGNIEVARVRYANLDERVRTAIKRVFKNFELSVSLGPLRSVQVFVVGNARRPGTYTVSALSTLVNALFVSGGPSNNGSMRRIQLKRGGKVVTEFDLYDLLLNGDTSKDARLLPGDVIFIPPVGPRAAIAGSVHTPAIYEVWRGASVGDLVGMAGGLTPNASGRKYTLERIIERRSRVVTERALDEAGFRYPLADGDVVTVYTLSPRIDNAVTLKGNVAQIMRFPWKRGMRVTDVIPERDALVVPDYWLNRNELGRPENWIQEAAKAPAKPDAEARPAAGAREGPPLTAQRLRSEVKRNSNEINWDYAVVERLDPATLSTTLIPFNLGKAVLERVPEQNVELMPGDVITVLSKEDIQVPAEKQTKYVRLEGEFVASGVYQVQAGETLRQVVQRAGGLTKQAYLYGADFTRESTRILQQKQLDEALSRLEEEAQRVALARSQAVLAPEDAQALNSQMLAMNALIARLRAAKATGRIVLDLPGPKVAVDQLPDLALEDGDRLYVPPMPSTIAVFGAVYNPNAYVYKNGRRLSDYLSRAGGPTKDADKGSMYLVKADGTVVSTRQKSFGGIGGEPMNPGDAVVVPESFERFNLTKELKDWTQILYQLALGVAGLAVLNDL
jgi:protein involved in polysaccharide export with SLBB domain